MYSIRKKLFNLCGKLLCFPIAVFMACWLMAIPGFASFEPPSEITVSQTQICSGDWVDLSFQGSETVFYWGFSTDGGISYPIIDSTFQNPISVQLFQNTLVRLDVRDEFDVATYVYLDLSVLTVESFVCPTSINLIQNSYCEVDIPDFLQSQNPLTQSNTLTYSQNPGQGWQNSVDFVEITYEGICSGQTVCTVEVFSIDTTAPVIDCESYISIDLPELSNQIEVTFPIPTVVEECSLFSLGNDVGGSLNNGVFTLGQTPVTWEVSDSFGNTSTCITTIDVIDNSPPTYLNCPDTLHFTSTSESCEGWVAYTPVVTDNVGITSFSNNLGYLAGDSVLITTGNYDIVWTATDVSGLSASCETHVIIDDVFAPVVLCPPSINAQVSSGSCSVMLNLPIANISDNCGIEDTWSVPSGPSYEFGIGTSYITYYAEDYEDHVSQCITEVIVTDIHPPVIYCPSTLSAIASSETCTAFVDAPVVNVTDNCTVASSWNELNNGLSLPATLEQGNYMVSWFATDIHGNQSTCFTMLTVSDLEGPQLNCPPVIELSLDQNCSAIVPNLSSVAISAFDCTGLASFNQFPLPGSSANGASSIQITAYDIWGNESVCQSELILVDAISPQIISCLSDQTIALSENCDFSIPDYRGSLSVSDNCTAILEILQYPLPGTIINTPGEYSIQFVVYDASGNQTSCQFEITLQDQEEPEVLSVGTAGDLYMGQDCQVATPDFTGLIVFEDACSPNLIITQIPSAGTPINTAGQQTVTVIAEDDYGNYSEVEILFGVIDTIRPVLIPSISELTLYLDNTCTTILPDLESFVFYEDNCGSAVLFNQNPSAGFQFSSPGMYDVQVGATDIWGNQNTSSILIVVEDNMAPVLTCNPLQVYELTGDLCAEWVDLEIPEVQENCSSVGLTNSLNNLSTQFFAGPGNYPYIWSAIDEYGNESQCSSELVIVDVSSPIIDCPEDISYCDDYVSIEIPQAYDNCGILSTEITHSDWISSGIFPFGETPITITVTDIHGNVSTCTFSVHHYDPDQCCPIQPEAGTIIVADLDHYCQGDNISLSVQGYIGQLQWQYSLNGFDWLDFSEANSEEFSFALMQNTWVRIRSEIPFCETAYSDVSYFETYELPTPTCLPDQELFNDSNCEVYLPDYTESWSLQYSNPSFVYTQTPADGSTLSTGIYNVTLQVEGYCGQIDQCTFEVSVVDTIRPVFQSDWPLDLVLPLGSNCEMTLPSDLLELGSALDNCTMAGNIALTIFDITQDDSAHQTHLTLQATDESGNSSWLEWTIQFIDQLAPQIICAGSVNVNVESNCTAEIPDISQVISFSDNCGIASVTQIPDAGTLVGPGDIDVEFIVTDISGISNSCITQVHVLDVAVPIISCQEDTLVYLDNACQTSVPDLTSLVIASDECDYTLTQIPLAGTSISETTLVSIYAIDPSGNQSSCEITVQVLDTIAGEITCPDNIVTYVTAEECQSLVEYEVLFTDNCSGVWPAIESGPASGSYLEAGVYTVSCSALENGTDLHTCTFTISVIDTIAPILPPDYTIVTCDPLVQFDPPSAIEPCYASIYRIDANGFNPGDELPFGTTEFIYVAEDASGNTDTTHIVCIVENPGILEFTSPEIGTCNNGEIVVLYDYINSNINWLVSTSAYANGIFDPSEHLPGIYEIVVENEGGSCEVSDTLQITVHENGIINYTGPTGFCGTQAELSFGGNCSYVSSTVFPDGVFVANDELNDCSLTVPSEGDYLIEVFGQTEFNCVAQLEIEIAFSSPVSGVFAGDDIVIYQPQQMDITGLVDGSATGSWTQVSGDAELVFTSENFMLVDIAIPGESFFVFTSMDVGCGEFTDTLRISLESFSLPNTITPNGDGINDLFIVPGADRLPCAIMIYDRWGYPVFQTRSYRNDWPEKGMSGRSPEGDVYYYEIILDKIKHEGFIMVKDE